MQSVCSGESYLWSDARAVDTKSFSCVRRISRGLYIYFLCLQLGMRQLKGFISVSVLRAIDPDVARLLLPETRGIGRARRALQMRLRSNPWTVREYRSPTSPVIYKVPYLGSASDVAAIVKNSRTSKFRSRLYQIERRLHSWANARQGTFDFPNNDGLQLSLDAKHSDRCEK
jgi:hypothetical protein